jgi:hypothetical protein
MLSDIFCYNDNNREYIFRKKKVFILGSLGYIENKSKDDWLITQKWANL